MVHSLISKESSILTRSFLIRLLLCALGGGLMGIAVVLFMEGGYGADPMSTLLQGMGQQLHLSVDTCNNLLSFAMVLAAVFIDRKQIHIGTILFPLMSTLTIQFVSPLLQAQTPLQHIVFAGTGVLVIALSIAISAKADCGKNPLDCLCYGLMKKLHSSYRVIRWILDGAMLAGGIAMSGTFGMITIINLVFLGTLIMSIMKILDHWDWIMKHIQLKEETHYEKRTRNIS